jgi:hypothetical protein
MIKNWNMSDGSIQEGRQANGGFDAKAFDSVAVRSQTDQKRGD